MKSFKERRQEKLNKQQEEAIKKAKSALTSENIISVVILEQVQLYSSKTAHGSSSKWGPILNSDYRDIEFPISEPCGCEYTFSVTFKDHHKEVVKLRSGTKTCELLLQLAIDPTSVSDTTDVKDHVDQTHVEEYVPFELGKNQLPKGIYEVGVDIPEGTYDFEWVFGEPHLKLTRSRNIDEKGCFIDAAFIAEYPKITFQTRQWLNIEMKKGMFLHIRQNGVVSIKRSKKVVIDL